MSEKLTRTVIFSKPVEVSEVNSVAGRVENMLFDGVLETGRNLF